MKEHAIRSWFSAALYSVQGDLLWSKDTTRGNSLFKKFKWMDFTSCCL